jgi:hypothetical protein
MTLINGITPSIIDRFWSGIRPEHPDLVFALSERFEALTAMPQPDRERAAALLLDLEAGVPDAVLADFLAAELRALTTLPSDGAKEVLRSIDSLTTCQAGSSAMRRTIALQAASRDLSLDEVSRLEPAMPTVRQMAGLPPAKPVESETTDLAAAIEAPPAKRWSLARLFSRQ